MVEPRLGFNPSDLKSIIPSLLYFSTVIHVNMYSLALEEYKVFMEF